MTNKKVEKYSLPCVNKGKPFTPSAWTNRKHKAVLAEVAKYQDKLEEKELDEKYRRVLVLTGLHEIDASVTEADLDELHPDDLLSLFTAIYLQGRKGIISTNFRKAQKSQKPTK